MVDDVAEPNKGIGAGVQVAAALVLAAGVLGGMWGLGLFRQKSADSKPAVCSGTHDVLPPQYVSGAQLCAALNRPDLPTLLGTPADHAETAGGSGDWITSPEAPRSQPPRRTSR